MIIKQKTLDEDVRKHLRVPVKFDTFIFSQTRAWRGRRKAVSEDLSADGIAFCTEQKLAEGERLEIIIPITEQPLVVQCRILRKRSNPDGGTLYACKFINLCNNEEAMIREAVFNTQLAQRSIPQD